MRSRCGNPNSIDWSRYGGRGVECRFDSVHDLIAEIGFRPSRDYTVGRINNDGHYEPGNVRWETALQQGANKSTNIQLTFEGETLHLAAWGRRLGIKKDTLYQRYKKGWPVEEILAPARAYRKKA